MTDLNIFFLLQFFFKKFPLSQIGFPVSLSLCLFSILNQFKTVTGLTHFWLDLSEIIS